MYLVYKITNVQNNKVYIGINTKISVPEIAKQLKMKTGVIYGINDGKTHRDMHSYPIPIRNKKGA